MIFRVFSERRSILSCFVIDCWSEGGSTLRKASILMLSILSFQVARPTLLFAQQPQPQPLTLSRSVDLALSNYPAIRAAQAQAAAASEGIDLARMAYLPRTDLLWQENRATKNNIFGALL